jgi:hypothetical protein
MIWGYPKMTGKVILSEGYDERRHGVRSRQAVQVSKRYFYIKRRPDHIPNGKVSVIATRRLLSRHCGETPVPVIVRSGATWQSGIPSHARWIATSLRS